MIKSFWEAMKNEKLKRVFFIIKAVIIAGVSITLVVLFILSQEFSLDLKEYQKVYATNGKVNYFKSVVIDTKKDELTFEKKLGVNIKDGIDYANYSLVISRYFEIIQCKMNFLDHPGWCLREGKDCGSIFICWPDWGKKYDNTYFVYSVGQKNIISGNEIGELDWS